MGYHINMKNAALHFRSYLQTEGYLDANGSIDKQKLFDIFANEYQPKFHSHLCRGNIMVSLARARAIHKKKKNKDNNKIMFILDSIPQNTPCPESKPKLRVFVNEEFVFKHAPEKQPSFTTNRCHICKEDFNSQEDFECHLDEETHTFREQYRNAKNKFRKEIDGIEIKFIGLEDEALQSKPSIILRENEVCKVVTIEVINTTNKTEYTLEKIFKVCDLPQVSLQSGELPQLVRPGIPLRYNLEPHFTTSGAYIYPVVFKFHQINNNDRRKSVQCVLREIVFRIQSELMDLLKPTAAYNRPQRKIINLMEGPVLEGIPIPYKHTLPPRADRLKEYKIPQLVMLLLKSKLQPIGENMARELEVKLQEIKQLLGNVKSYKDSLTVKNYAARFHLLLYLEEFKTDVDIRDYDKSEQKMEKQKKNGVTMFCLKVEGLSENRPSVLRGDKIYVYKGSDRSVRYEGIVHEVQEDKVLLGFHKDLERAYLPNMKFDVFFSNNRYPIMMFHRAVELLDKHNGTDVIFPQQKLAASQPVPSHHFTWVNKNIGENPEQQQAVRSIINKTSSPAPYLIFGPPGTGKTVTVVEAICQIWHLNPTKPVKQLVCAPSNAACNVLTKRLLKYLPKGAKLLRLYAMSVSYSSICEEFKTAKIVNMLDGDVYMPSKEKIMTYDIIICTTVTAGRLVTFGVLPFHFSYVFVDECGQAIEPEALIPVSGILTDISANIKGQLVLAGDPKQLGPILRSRLASEMGLGMSLLERLMEHNPLYQKNTSTGKYDSQYLTKLVQNYRSHRCILEIPNKCFYDNELQVKGEGNEINKALKWQYLPKANFPIIFNGVIGQDEKEHSSPSYFNRQEIDKVVQYLKLLIGEKLSGYKVEEKDIGIITPYRKQVQKFQTICRKLGWKNLKIGSVEEFQGDERLIIIISTVRSTQNLLDEDYYFNLGFLKNPKRFNVSVTRAKALLIVVGNPFVLRCDPHWYALLKFCGDNSAFTGHTIPLGSPPQPPPNIYSLGMDFAAMSLSGDRDQNHPEGGVSFRREQ